MSPRSPPGPSGPSPGPGNPEVRLLRMGGAEEADPGIVPWLAYASGARSLDHLLRGRWGAVAAAGDDRGEAGAYCGLPTALPSGEMAYQVPPTPWPLMSPGFLSPAKV
ncbi:hypothetical protein GCM10010145_33150 [Streptomyces ruber]|uniref:Uncharacterized protein n=2 Tax=Streptomyces TaxID=1883 RepID=A0A918ER71_9ACTN|nr:hypothetical protein GCM10010145_33150 [Streptomyces ruber]